jgi:poly-gamma-glutamate capsule biosynthesis protein CapA/YwtB (metallophosphatase superfamily)
MRKIIVLLTAITAALAAFLLISGYQLQPQKLFGEQKTAPVQGEKLEKLPSSETPKEREEDTIIVPETTVSTATLSAVGDILIHDTVYEQAYQSNGTYDFSSMFELVKPYVGQAEIAVANQETMIGGADLGVSSYPSFNSPYEVGDALKEIGVDIVTIANNHTLDRGEKAILNALDHWDELGIPYTGSYRSEEDRVEIRTLTENDITFSFLAYTYGTNGIPVPEGKDHLVNLIDSEQILEDIEEAKDFSDVVVVNLHFGNEYQRMPSDEQKALATEVANAGADIIIGHHPHVLQPMDWIEKDNGERAFVAYSLGNFISGQRWDYKDIGGILQIEVEKTKTGDDVKIELKEPAFIPTFVVYGSFIITPLEQLNDQKTVYQEIKKHMSQWVPELKFTFE